MADRDIAIRVSADIGSYRSALQQAGRDTQQLATQGQRAGGTMSSAFKLAAGSAAAIGVGKLVKDSIELEAAYSKTMRLVATQTKAPAAALRELDDLAMQLGADTVFSAQDAADAMLELAKGGLSTAQIEAGALKDALTLAAAGSMDLSTAANSVVNTMGAFGLEADETGSAVAALAGAANASSADVSDITQALAQAGTEANSAGLSVQETTAILAAFSNAGIQGSDAGTSLRTMLTRLVPQTDAQAKAMDALGLSFTNANGEFVGAEEIAGRLQTAFKGMSAEERTQALNTIFGADARRAANVLIQEGAEGIRGYVAETSDLTAAEKLSAAAMDGTSGGLEQLSGAVETAKIAIGKGLAPTVEELSNRAADLIEGADMEGWAEDAGAGLESFVDRVTPLAESLYELSSTALPVLADVGGVVVDALTLAADVVTPVVDAFNELPESAQKALILAAGAKTVANRLGPLPDLASSAGGSLLVFGGNADRAGDKAKSAGGKFGILGGNLQTLAAYAAGSLALQYGWDGIQDGVKFFRQLSDESGTLADTMDRNGRAAAETVEGLLDSFASGRIGKHADDLGIDMDRLAESLAKGGEKGEYVREVLQDLDDSYSASSEALGDAGSFFLTTDGERVGQTRAAIQDIIGDLERAGVTAIESGDRLDGFANDFRLTSAGIFDYRAELQDLPSEVVTEIVTPGAIDSRKDVADLAREFELTPEEVTAIMRVLDFASDDIERVIDSLDKAGKKKPKPKVSADTGPARREIQWVEGAVGYVDGLTSTFDVGANTSPARAAISSLLSFANSLPFVSIGVGPGSYAGSRIPEGYAAGGRPRVAGPDADQIPHLLQEAS